MEAFNEGNQVDDRDMARKRGLESDLSVYREERQTKQLHYIVIGEACLPPTAACSHCLRLVCPFLCMWLHIGRHCQEI